MTLHHFFSQRTDHGPLKSTYEIEDEETGKILLRSTGSAVKCLRTLRRNGLRVPVEMNGPQTRQYSVEL